MIPLLLHLVILFFIFQYAPQHIATICHATTCHARRNMTSRFNVRAGFASLLCPINRNLLSRLTCCLVRLLAVWSF
jgi:hypothetical protein